MLNWSFYRNRQNEAIIAIFLEKMKLQNGPKIVSKNEKWIFRKNWCKLNSVDTKNWNRVTPPKRFWGMNCQKVQTELWTVCLFMVPQATIFRWMCQQIVGSFVKRGSPKSTLIKIALQRLLSKSWLLSITKMENQFSSLAWWSF